MKAPARRRWLTVSIVGAVALVGALLPAAQAVVSGPFVRPKGATPVKYSLVPAYNTCTAPNTTHGPPLAAPACSPPVESSTSVTVGTADANGAAENSEGSFKMKVQVGVPGAPNDSDIIASGSITDVRCKPGTTACGNANMVDGPDYTGLLEARVSGRITDRFNAVVAGGGSDGATLVDNIPFPFQMTCAATASVLEGSVCTVTTSSYNANVPNSIRDGKRMVIQLGQVTIGDGGPDGVVSTLPNTPFMRSGVFVP